MWLKTIKKLLIDEKIDTEVIDNVVTKIDNEYKSIEFYRTMFHRYVDTVIYLHISKLGVKVYKELRGFIVNYDMCSNEKFGNNLIDIQAGDRWVKINFTRNSTINIEDLNTVDNGIDLLYNKPSSIIYVLSKNESGYRRVKVDLFYVDNLNTFDVKTQLNDYYVRDTEEFDREGIEYSIVDFE